MLINLPCPPLPNLAQSDAFMVAAAAIIVGAALLVWGRILGRPLIALLAGSAGFLYGGQVADLLSIPPVVGQFALAIGGLIVVYLADRVVWGALAIAVAAIPAAIVMLGLYPPADAKALPATAPAADSLTNYATGLALTLKADILDLWQTQRPTILIAFTAIALFFMLIALIRPRLIRIVMTSLIGAVAIVAGLLTAVTAILPSMWNQAWQLCYVPAGLCAALFILGIVVQYRAAIKAQPAAPASDKETPATKKQKAEDAEARRLNKPNP